MDSMDGWSVKHITDRSFAPRPTGRLRPRDGLAKVGKRAPCRLRAVGPHPRQRAFVGRALDRKMYGPGFLLFVPTNSPATGSPRTTSSSRISSHDPHYAHPHGADPFSGPLTVLTADRPPQLQPLDHPYSGSQPLQQYLHGGSFQSFRRIAMKPERTLKNKSTEPMHGPSAPSGRRNRALPERAWPTRPLPVLSTPTNFSRNEIESTRKPVARRNFALNRRDFPPLECLRWHGFGVCLPMIIC